ncbi:hypothetical protein, partial [Psychromonas aquatilis]
PADSAVSNILPEKQFTNSLKLASGFLALWLILISGNVVNGKLILPDLGEANEVACNWYFGN